ncbi:MAG: YchJ family protein [Nitrospirae bacterium]|nr:YchJ family protein [Nitrospirota bacterium]
MMEKCPCGSDLLYSECCGPIIKGERPAVTAEQLMRSRYSAYVEKEIPYLLTSLHPGHRKDYDEKNTRGWAESAQWHKLDIIRTEAGGQDDTEGKVEFIASFTQGAKKVDHHELATFKKEEGLWYFVSGESPSVKTVVRASPKVGRNDPCSCGSGKKFKKCCGQ